MIYTADRETGTFIDEFKTVEEAHEAIRRYEEEDKKDGIYTEDFYDVIIDERITMKDNSDHQVEIEMLSEELSNVENLLDNALSWIYAHCESEEEYINVIKKHLGMGGDRLEREIEMCND